jgi:hypothetical protein
MLAALLLLFNTLANPALAAAQMSEIRISLFGQPCLLQGPVDTRTLKTIHSVSPEELYPQRGATLSSEPTRKALDKLKSIAGVPSGLDRYRERLGKRLEAQLVALEAIESLRKTRKAAALTEAGKKFLSGRRLKEFDSSVAKALAIKDLGSEKGREALDAVFDGFSDGIEGDPEEEFHRAIHRMNIQYTCSFEESGGGEGAE